MLKIILESISDILHKKYRYNMLKYTERRGYKEKPVDKLVIVSYNAKYRNRLHNSVIWRMIDG